MTVRCTALDAGAQAYPMAEHSTKNAERPVAAQSA